jgi:UPF0176 protein
VHYQRGVSCPHCYEQLTDDRKARLRERQKQVDLAASRGQRHIGGPPPARQLRERSSQGRILDNSKSAG